MKEGLQAAENDYQALNAQLKDELPKFNRLVFAIYKDCVMTFVTSYHRYQSESLKLLYPLLQVTHVSLSTVQTHQYQVRQYLAGPSVLCRPIRTVQGPQYRAGPSVPRRPLRNVQTPQY